jgi:adenylate cyclase class IV
MIGWLAGLLSHGLEPSRGGPREATVSLRGGWRVGEVGWGVGPGYDARVMAANVEIKARLRDPERVRHLIEQATGGPPQVIEQEDTFFPVAAGRLKIRILGPGRGELIAYRRTDAAGPKVSEYLVVPTTEPALLRDALAVALGVRGTVRKTRLLFLVGATRVHLDTVEQLGNFLELEVVLRPAQSVAEGEVIARELMEWLGIAEVDLLEGAYIDML